MSDPEPVGRPLTVDWARLRDAAAEVASHARASYSGLHVGAAALTDSGEIVVGCNVENVSYGLTLCAECGVVSAAQASDAGAIVALTARTPDGQLLMPCGRCRQILAEAGPATMLIDAEPEPVTIAELLPHAFVPDDLP